MSVLVSVEEVGPWRKQLTVEVPAPAIRAETAKVLQEFGRQVKLPGFRSGKVPEGILRQRFGKEIDKEVVERLLPRFWKQAQEESRLDPMLPPEVQEVGEIAQGEPLKFVAVVETRPEIEIGELSGFDLPEVETDPTQEELEEALGDLRRQAGEWITAERAAARGDLVVAEIRRLQDDADEETQTIRVAVGDSNVWEELSLAVTGLSAGQSGRFRRQQGSPEEAPGEVQEFEVQVTEVKERELPPLDDELAKRLGDFEDVDTLKKAVEQQIRGGKEAERHEKRQTAFLDELRRRHPVTLPRGVVDHEVQNMLNEYAENLATRGLDLEKTEIEWGKVGEEMRPSAEARVHARLLLDAAADKQEVTVDDREVEVTIAALARREGKTARELHRSLEEAGRLGSVRGQLRRDKTIRGLLGENPQTGPQDGPGDLEGGEG